jgi:PPP family 3-phenylpropionic acid transporter
MPLFPLFLHAFTFGTFHTAAIAYVNGKVEHERRGMGMAIYSAVGLGLPSFLASVAGGYLLQCRGFNTLFLTYAAVPLLGIVVLAAFGSPRVVALRAEAMGEANARRLYEGSRCREKV